MEEYLTGIFLVAVRLFPKSIVRIAVVVYTSCGKRIYLPVDRRVVYDIIVIPNAVYLGTDRKAKDYPLLRVQLSRCRSL